MASPDIILSQRVGKLPADAISDYATGEGQDDVYRYLGQQTKYPWGALLRHKHTCSIVDPATPNIFSTTALRGPLFHLILDGTLHVTTGSGSLVKPSVKRWTLRLGKQVVQNIDSKFAADIINIFKRDYAPTCEDADGVTFSSPFFFSEDLLKVLPLFMNNSMPLVFEFEFELLPSSGIEVSFFCEYVTSNLEASGYDETFIQFVPNFTTSEITVGENDRIEINLNSRGKVVKSIYFRVFDESSPDRDDVVKNVELKGTESFPGIFCRKYFKQKYGCKDFINAPYYVLPICPNPRSSMPSYGEVFKDDKLILQLNKKEEYKGCKIEVTLETIQKIAWLVP